MHIRRFAPAACFTAALLAAMLTASPAAALDVGITAKVGTLGYGGDVTLGLLDYLNLRVGFNMFQYTHEDTASAASEAVDFNAELDLQSTMALVDLYLGATEFRVTGGIVLNGNELRITANPNDLVEIGDGEYRLTSASGGVSFRDMAPYVGLGYGNAAGEGHFHFSFDLGVMLHGTPDVALAATAANPALQAALDADIQREIDDIEDDTNQFTAYPVLSFGISYSF